MTCKIIGIPHRKICLSDLRHRVTLHSRNIKAPGFDQVDFDEVYTPIGVVWAAIKTTNGKVQFDGVADDVPLTHAVYTRHRTDLTSETWVELSDGRLLDVVDTEDLDERHDWILLACTEKGTKEKPANLT